MNCEWDGGGIAFNPEVWRQCLRVLKPGGHMTVFGGARTHHRVWCAVEDAGFEIRDSLFWLHGQGFPKSLDVAKSIQSLNRHGKPRFDNADDPEAGDVALPGELWIDGATGMWTGKDMAVTDPEASRWQGWGSALKPSYEPILLARKPLDGTIAANTLKHGVGGLNIDACRVPAASAEDLEQLLGYWNKATTTDIRGQRWIGGISQGVPCTKQGNPKGRWPSNVCHDGSGEVLAAFAAYGNHKTGDISPYWSENRMGLYDPGWSNYQDKHYKGDNGSVARFYYCAKARKSEKGDSSHPTIKPQALISWLMRMICPVGGHVLDPFAGSGTTGIVARELGLDATLIELQLEYVQDIERRCQDLPVP